jgi:transposase
MPTVEVARSFGVGISSVKRYAKTARQGGSPRPKKSPGRPPKADEHARRLLEVDLKERPAATLSERREFLRSVAGLRVSHSTVSRLLRRMGFSRKKIGGCERARRVVELRLASAPRRAHRCEAIGLRGGDGIEHVAGTPVCVLARRRASACQNTSQLGANITLLASMSAGKGWGAALRSRAPPLAGCSRSPGAGIGAVASAGASDGDGQPLGAQGWPDARDRRE